MLEVIYCENRDAVSGFSSCPWCQMMTLAPGDGGVQHHGCACSHVVQKSPDAGVIQVYHVFQSSQSVQVDLLSARCSK